MSRDNMTTVERTRRNLLRGLIAVPGAALISSMPGLSFSPARAADSKRFILVILRGAMDGIAAVTPYGDAALPALRGPLLPQTNELHKLDSHFGLHPAFSNLYAMYEQAQLLPCHAVASPYRKRSHFDGQNVLETGLDAPDESASGWLNRCIPLLAESRASPAIAIGQSVPEVLLGDNEAASWSPPRFPMASEDTLARLLQLYKYDGFLGSRLERALEANALVGNGMANAKAKAKARDFNLMIDAAATFLSHEQGPAMAVLQNGGWDTHANQGGARGQLANKFSRLDTGLARLKQGLGGYWQHTVVAVVTEFGRTVAVNGTQGTDHGTASVAFLLGGAVKGGKVHGTWPGLEKGNLHNGRDLKPTTDLRSLFKSILRDHLAIDAEHIEMSIFPASSSAGYISGLV